MNNSRLTTIIAFVALLLAAVALAIAYSGRKQPGDTGSGGKSEPNLAQTEDRVKNTEERARMERYVAELQAAKKVIKSFPGPSGETIDCVDVYQQPALRQKGLEGHVVLFQPTTKFPTTLEEQAPQQQQQPSPQPQQQQPSPQPQQQLQQPPPPQQQQGASRAEDLQPTQLFTLTGQTCPDKTAPMARLTMDTLKRFETLEEFFQKRFADIQNPTGGGSSSSSVIHEYAHAARSVANWGAESNLNVWSPYVEKANEFSLSQIWVVRGSGSSRETVETGWQVYRDLYGDWRAHLFIYFTPDNYGSGGCYNLSCNGFVQTNSSVYIGGGFTNYSSEGGSQYVIKLLLYKDGTEGHWWLKYNDTWVGYYPRSLFDSNGLRNEAERVDFGGEIINRRTDNRHTRTDMGSGNWPYQGFGYAAYQRGLRYVDTSNFYRRATGLNRSVTDRDCYDLDLLSSSGSWEEYFYFGGSGFNTSCP